MERSRTLELAVRHPAVAADRPVGGAGWAKAAVTASALSVTDGNQMNGRRTPMNPQLLPPTFAKDGNRIHDQSKPRWAVRSDPYAVSDSPAADRR